MKFGRRYKITIQVTDATAIIIELPFTIRFNIHRTAMASLNGMTLQIYNLDPTYRDLIYQDRFDIRRFKIIVEAGYEELSRVFVGDIYEANSTRSGTDIITTIDARDGNFDTNQSVVNATLAAGTTLEETLQYLRGQFPNLGKGKLDNVGGYFFKRPVVLEGNVYEQIKKYAMLGGKNMVWIDMEVVNIAGANEVIVNKDIEVIDASTGLIETPRRDNSYLTVTTLFEPRVVMGQVVQLISSVMPQYNGLYKVIGATHTGIISGAVSGKANSVFNLLGEQILNGFKVLR